MNKISVIFILISLSLISIKCTNDKIETSIDYWGDNEKGQIRRKCSFRNGLLDGYCYRYYSNGQLMSKAIYKKDHLRKIVCVYDTLGRKLDFGSLDENGTGYVITYSDEYGTRERSGQYINGRREGWWKNYTYRGDPTDSVFYKNSRPDFLNTLDIVMY